MVNKPITREMLRAFFRGLAAARALAGTLDELAAPAEAGLALVVAKVRRLRPRSRPTRCCCGGWSNSS
ncbi:MAG: hypothetical protein ACK41F_13060 [Fimbriimonadaceae bacterium]